MLAQLQGGVNFRRRFPRLGGQVCMRIYTLARVSYMTSTRAKAHDKR
jgi:hypothetical protein